MIFDAHVKPYVWPVEKKVIAERKKRMKRSNVLSTKLGIEKFLPAFFREDPIDKSDFLIKEMDKHGISKALVTSAILHVSNDFIAGMINRYEDRLIGFGLWLHSNTLDGFKPEEAAEEVRRAIKDLGLRGIGEWALKDLYPIPPHEIHLRREFTIIMNMIAKLGVPVLFHAGWSPFPSPLRYSDPMIIDDIACIYPEVPIIIGHSAKTDFYFHSRAIMVAKQHDNIYLETSHQPAKNIEKMIQQVGADRCLFATNWMPPGHSGYMPNIYKQRLETLKKIKMTEEEQEMFLYKNLKNLLDS